MARITVYRYEDSGPVADGTFDADRAVTYGGRRGAEGGGEILCRTDGGRWVLHCWAEAGEEGTYRHVDAAAARAWLDAHGYED